MERDDKERLNLSLETFRGNLEGTIELLEVGFLEEGTKFGIGELAECPSMDMLKEQVTDPDAWIRADKEQREKFLRNVFIELGLVPESLTRERAERTFEDKGMRNVPSEGGAEVMVFKTWYPGLDLHVLDYGNSDIGRRYNLVVGS